MAQPNAVKLEFPSAAPKWRAVSTSDISQTVFLGAENGGPDKARVDLLAPGMLLYFSKDLEFVVHTKDSPLITWDEGTVDSNVPSAASKWLALSFREEQPPVLLTFLDAPCKLKVVGREGIWRIRATDGYTGWVRLCAPVGELPRTTNNAADLGQLSQEVVRNLAVMSESPQIIATEIKDDPTAIEVTWRFDRPGAVVPWAATLAPLGGYGIRVLSPVRQLFPVFGGYPMSVTEGDVLTIRFPMRRLPLGRSLAYDAGPLAPVDKPDMTYASVYDLAIANTTAYRDPKLGRQSAALIDQFISTATYAEEPNTGQRLPYAANGEGLELAAACALLSQTLASERATSSGNALLTSIMWRRDWCSWTISCEEQSIRRRAGALAALAGAFCPEPERRLEAAMLQAGLAAERGLAIWRARLDRTEPAKLLEPVEDLRAAIFAGPDAPLGPVERMLSEVRSYGGESIRLDRQEGRVIASMAAAKGPVRMAFVSSVPLKVTPTKGFASVRVVDGLGFSIVEGQAEGGDCLVEVALPEWARPIPTANGPIRYSEQVR